jgi:hypothetical protein
MIQEERASARFSFELANDEQSYSFRLSLALTKA